MISLLSAETPFASKRKFESEFDIKYLGSAEFLLGMNIDRSPGILHIHQTQYIERKISEYGLDDAPIASCPLDPKSHLRAATTHDAAEFQKLGVLYCALIGSLNYLSVLTRPDVSYAVSVLSQHLENPGMTHYRAAQQVFCYLKGTKQVGLLFRKEPLLALSCHVDADWGNCPDTQRSVTGYVVLTNAQLLSSKATRQATVSLSSTEAEYKALSDLGREVAWFNNLISEIHVDYKPHQIPVGVDNQGAIDLARSKMSQNGFRTKHMDIRLHFVRELIVTHIIKLNYIRTTENSADFLTKPTGQCTIRKSLAAIGVMSPASIDDNKNISAHCLATQSNPGCWIISADQSGAKRTCVRDDHVTPSGKSLVSHHKIKSRPVADLQSLMSYSCR
jgi:hypothetical protein